MYRLSLRMHVAATIAILVVGVSLILGWAISSTSGERIRQDIGNALAEVARQKADKLDRSMAARVSEARLVASMTVLEDGRHPDAIRRSLEQLQANYEVASWVGFMDSEGTVIAGTGHILEGVNIAHRPVFREGRNGLWVGDVHEAVMLAKLMPDPSREPVKFVDVALPIHRDDGTLSGVLAIHLSWKWASVINQSMMAPETEHQGTEVFVAAKDGTVLLGPPTMIGQSLSPLKALHRAMPNGWSVEVWPDGQRYVTGRALSDGEGAFPGLDWTVLTRRPVESAFAPVQALWLRIGAFGLLLTVVFATLGWVLAGRLSAPLARLAQAADRLDQDMGPEVIPLEDTTCETYRLSVSLRSMVARFLHQDQTIDRLQDAAHTDRLTGLPNRAFLEQYLSQALPESRREDKALALLFLDLDGFKRVNDDQGHQAGDRLLIEVAARLRGCLRGGDIAVRLGGDEFVLVLTTLPDTAADWLARAVGQRIVQAIAQPITLPNIYPAHVGCSVGIAFWPTHGEDVETVLAHADAALYVAKATGKGRVVVHGEDDPATAAKSGNTPAR